MVVFLLRQDSPVENLNTSDREATSPTSLRKSLFKADLVSICFCAIYSSTSCLPSGTRINDLAHVSTLRSVCILHRSRKALHIAQIVQNSAYFTDRAKLLRSRNGGGEATVDLNHRICLRPERLAWSGCGSKVLQTSSGDRFRVRLLGSSCE